MDLLLVFALALLAAVLLSELASRSVLSTSVLFLAAGFLAGPGVLGIVDVGPEQPGVRRLAELALFSVLFTDGMRIGAGELRGVWKLPGRALVFGMPLVFAGTMGLARWMLDLPWIEAALLAAVLTPTDPVFAAAVVGQEDVPQRLRRLLNVESGVNDGFSLPLVLVLLAYAQGSEPAEPLALVGEVALGIAIGVIVPWVVLRLERSPALASHQVYEPLLAVAIGLGVYGLTAVTEANEFLAAFAAGMTVASTSSEARDDFRPFGEVATELLKLGALLVFGALLTPALLVDFGIAELAFAALALLLVRPIAVALALVGSALDWRETLVAAWFGPKGFASVVFALLVLQSGVEHAARLYHVAAIVIAVSIIAHSSTDTLIARWFRRSEELSPRPMAESRT